MRYGNHPATASRTVRDSPPVKIARFISVNACARMLKISPAQVVSHCLGFCYERGRLGRLVRKPVVKWLIRKEARRGIIVAIGADDWPIELR
jgi:hypothetical protein